MYPETVNLRSEVINGLSRVCVSATIHTIPGLTYGTKLCVTIIPNNNR